MGSPSFSMLVYPAAVLYPLGFLGLGIQLWRDPLFPYSRLDTVWNAVSLSPETVVIGTGVRLLFLAFVSTAFGVGVSVLVVRGLMLLGRSPAPASDVIPGGRRWMLFLVLLVPIAVMMMWYSVRLNSRADVALFVAFFVFSAGAGLIIGYVRWSSDREYFTTSLVTVYAGSIAAAICLAASQTPQLPIVEIQAERSEPHRCAEVPAEDTFVMLDRADEFLYVYNTEGMFSLPDSKAETLRFRECQRYLDRD